MKIYSSEISGSLKVRGDIFAENYVVKSTVSTITQSFSSGSTIFGDSNDDTHRFTGSLDISGSIGLKSDSRNNLFIGQNAGTGSGIGQNNTAIGIDALTSPRGAESIIAIGRNAGQHITKSTQSGVYSILIGVNANYNNSVGSNNIAIGQSAAGHSTNTMSNTVAIGGFVADAGPGPTNSTVIGIHAFGNVSGGHPQYVTALGGYALYGSSNTTTGINGSVVTDLPASYPIAILL